jgi:hypothetical protein
MTATANSTKTLEIMQDIAEHYSGPGATGRTVLQGMWEDYVNGNLTDSEWLDDVDATESEIVNILATLSLLANTIGLDQPVAGIRPF